MTYLFYDCEEVEAERNGLHQIGRSRTRSWLAADFAILLEPTYGLVEAGCQGTMRVDGRPRTASARTRPAPGSASTRSTRAGEVLRAARRRTRPREVTIDGCDYREGLNAVGDQRRRRRQRDPGRVRDRRQLPVRAGPRRGGRPRRTCARSSTGTTSRSSTRRPARCPAWTAPAAQEFLAAVGTPPIGKLGWTDVARFAALGIPALNFGPGDPNLAHKPDEHVEIPKIRAGARDAARAGCRPADAPDGASAWRHDRRGRRHERHRPWPIP